MGRRMDAQPGFAALRHNGLPQTIRKEQGNRVPCRICRGTHDYVANTGRLEETAIAVRSINAGSEVTNPNLAALSLTCSMYASRIRQLLRCGSNQMPTYPCSAQYGTSNKNCASYCNRSQMVSAPTAIIQDMSLPPAPCNIAVRTRL